MDVVLFALVLNSPDDHHGHYHYDYDELNIDVCAFLGL